MSARNLLRNLLNWKPRTPNECVDNIHILPESIGFWMFQHQNMFDGFIIRSLDAGHVLAMNQTKRISIDDTYSAMSHTNCKLQTCDKQKDLAVSNGKHESLTLD